MKLTTAIKKLAKHTEVKQNDNIYYGELNGHIIDFISRTDETITCIRVRGIKDEDDIMTDYWGGVWCDNLTQAIRMAIR